MTLLTIVLRRDTAILCTDSLIYDNDGRVLYDAAGTARESDKLFPLPNAPVIVTGRGSVALVDMLRGALAHVRDFETAAQAATELLAALVDASWLKGTYKGKPRRHEVILVGWSTVHERVERVNFEFVDGFKPERTHAPPSGTAMTLAPHVALGFDPLPDDFEGMEFLAVRQIEAARLEDRAAPYGGRLLLAAITATGIVMQAGCGVGYPEAAEGTTEPSPAYAIAPGAATAVQVTGPASGTRGCGELGANVLFYGAPMIDNTWANDQGIDITVLVDFTATAYKSGTGSGNNAVNFHTNLYGGVSPTDVDGPPVLAAEAQFSHIETIVVPAGSSITASIRSHMSSANMVTHSQVYRNATIRLTVLKR